MNVSIKINKNNIISEIDNRLYGSFIEHLGRAVYGGIYEPSSENSDENGFRKDIIELVKEMNVPVIRYPGGNFVSGYNWEDGTGDKSKRPKKLDLAWKSIETNEVGIDEFQDWAKKVNCDIIMAVNLGTRGAAEAGNLVEYCNLTTDTYYANMRKNNGLDNPFDIKTWCLGNEPDGAWQTCAMTSLEYGRKACEAAKVMKWTDDSIELIVSGSSNSNSQKFGQWEKDVLRETYDYIDYLSLHNYYGNPNNDSKEYLGVSLDMDRFIKQSIEICDEIQKEKGSDKVINLSFDEWNVWFHSLEQDKTIEKWSIAPRLLEDIYNLEDALVVGTMLITLINNSDRVKIACLAQLVNVIAPIMTEPNGQIWLQTIFYPYLHTLKYGRGTALVTEKICSTYTVNNKEIPYVETTAVKNDDNTITVFAVNRSLDKSAEVKFDIDGNAFKHITLTGDNLKESNSLDEPKKVIPTEKDIVDFKHISLPPQSWNVIRFKTN